MKVEYRDSVTVQNKYKHQCEYCGRKFKTDRTSKIHETTCVHNYDTTDEYYYVVENIVDVFGRIEQCWFLVKWERYEEPDWERERLLRKDGCHETIRSFWDRTGLSPCKDFYEDPEELHSRCDVCVKAYKRLQDLKSQMTRKRHHVDGQVKITATARRDPRIKKLEDNQNEPQHVKWVDQYVDNCWLFKYLGSIFETVGRQLVDV